METLPMRCAVRAYTWYSATSPDKLPLVIEPSEPSDTPFTVIWLHGIGGSANNSLKEMRTMAKKLPGVFSQQLDLSPVFSNRSLLQLHASCASRRLQFEFRELKCRRELGSHTNIVRGAVRGVK